MHTTQFKLMGTIDETYERAKAEIGGVSKNFIRQSVVSGVLPSIKAGRKYLINWNVFMGFLENPPQYGKPINTSGIRPVNF